MDSWISIWRVQPKDGWLWDSVKLQTWLVRSTKYLLHALSLCASQFSADVVSCNRQGDTIVAIDGWNPVSGRASDTDTIQDVTLFSASFDATINRLYCT